jgi:hypothetical protein
MSLAISTVLAGIDNRTNAFTVRHAIVGTLVSSTSISQTAVIGFKCGYEKVRRSHDHPHVKAISRLLIHLG